MISNTVVTTISPEFKSESVELMGENNSRRFMMLYNSGPDTCYINFGIDASVSGCSVVIAPYITWVWPSSQLIYTGAINGVRASGVGTVVVTEFNHPYAA